MKSEKEVREGLEQTIKEYRDRFKEELTEPPPEDWIRPWLLGQIDAIKRVLEDEK